MFSFHVGLDQPAEYQIKIQGRLSAERSQDSSLSGWFQGPISTSYEKGEQDEPITVLTGIIIDQAALHGLLAYIRNLGLTLLYVDCTSAHSADNFHSSID